MQEMRLKWIAVCGQGLRVGEERVQRFTGVLLGDEQLNRVDIA